MNTSCLSQFFYDSPLNAVNRVIYNNNASATFQMAIEAIHDRAKMIFECDSKQWALAVFNEGKKTGEVLTANHLEVAKTGYHGYFEGKLISNMCSSDRLLVSFVRSISLIGTFGAFLKAGESGTKKERGATAFWVASGLVGVAIQVWFIPKMIR